MPKGVSRAKHPELYGDKATTKAAKPTKFSKGARKLGIGVMHTEVNTSRLTEVTTHLQHLVNILATMPNNVIIASLAQEIEDVTEVVIEERRKIYADPLPEAKQEAAPEEATKLPAGPPVFTPPPAPPSA